MVNLHCFKSWEQLACFLCVGVPSPQRLYIFSVGKGAIYKVARDMENIYKLFYSSWRVAWESCFQKAITSGPFWHSGDRIEMRMG